jgi:hypothetical protein
MVWDRDLKGPAKFNGHPATELSEWQANEIKNEISESHSARTVQGDAPLARR